MSRLFARKADDKFSEIGFRPGATGGPILDAAFAWLECELAVTYEGGDHTIFVGRVVAAETGPAEPIVFYRGRFAALTSLE